jgi:hypothetical protein
MEQNPISLEEVYKKLIKMEAMLMKMDQYLEDLEFARRTEEAWQEIDEGKYTEMELNDFLKEIKKW